jgi:hypothetical protein
LFSSDLSHANWFSSRLPALLESLNNDQEVEARVEVGHRAQSTDTGLLIASDNASS